MLSVNGDDDAAVEWME